MAKLWFSRSIHSALLVILAAFALAASAQTTNPAYLSDMPSVDRVKAQIQGKDSDDTAARQVAVFTYLQQYVKRMKSSVRAPYTPDESRVLGNYSLAAYQIQQDYNKSHTPDQAKAFDTTQFNYMLNNGDEWSRKLIGPQSAAAYTATLNQMNTRQQAHVDSINKANEEAKANAAAAARAASGDSNDPTTLAARRCAELGGTTGGCATKAFGQGMVNMSGGQEITDMVDSFVGVYLSGPYNANGAAINFSVHAAQIGCGKLVPDNITYKLQRTASGVQVTVFSNPNITLALRPDGSLLGPGMVQVSGRIIVGYDSKTTTLVHQDGSEAWGCAGAYGSCRTTSSTPVYAPATARCNFATLAAPAPGHQATGAAADDGSFFGGANAFFTTVVTLADPGLRVNGKFLSPTGLILDFEGDAVTLDCGAAHVKAPYTVQNAPGEFHITVNNTGGPFNLTVAPDNTLRGSGSTTVSGKLYQSIKDGQISFRPVSNTCSVSMFTSKTPAEYRALIANPPAPGR